MKHLFILFTLATMASLGIMNAQNQVDVFIGRVVIDGDSKPYNPVKKFEVRPDSTSVIGHFNSTQQHRAQVDVLYSIYGEDGDCIVPLTKVSRDGVISIEEIPLATASIYRLNVIAREDCYLTLTPDFSDGTLNKTSIPLSSEGIYHIDLVVNGEE